MRLLPYCLSLCILLMIPTAGATQELLRYKSQPDKQLIYEHQTSTLIDTKHLRYQHPAKWKATEKVRHTDDGELEVSAIYTKVDETLSLKHHPPQRSSGGPGREELILHEVRGLLKNKDFSHRMTPQGALTSFTAPNDEGVRHRDKDPFHSVLSALEFECATRFPELPSDAVSVGDTWTSERTRSVAVPAMEDSSTISVVSTFKVKKAKKNKGFACFEIEGEVEVNSVGYIIAGEVSFVESGSGKGKIKLLFDYERGLIQKYEAEISSKTQIDGLSGLTENQQEGRSRTTYKWELKSVE
jgi:hypothetical protein